VRTRNIALAISQRAPSNVRLWAAKTAPPSPTQGLLSSNSFVVTTLRTKSNVVTNLAGRVSRNPMRITNFRQEQGGGYLPRSFEICRPRCRSFAEPPMVQPWE
jgi:hypothetical protein